MLLLEGCGLRSVPGVDAGLFMCQFCEITERTLRVMTAPVLQGVTVLKPTSLLFILSSALLIGCASVPDMPVSSSLRPDYVTAVTVSSSDTPASVARRAGGTVLAWPENCDAASDVCTALVGLEEMPKATTLSAQEVGAVEVNRDVFSGGGALTAVVGGSRAIWSGGSMTVWSSGSRAIWSGGTYSVLPENTGLWQKIGLERAHGLARNLGAGVVVAVVDTGIDLTHPAFAGALTAPGTWKDFYAGDAVPQEEGAAGTGAYGHGTNVAGIVLQVAPAAKILPIRALGPDGSGDVAGVAQAITYAADQGAQIINLSLGSAEKSAIIQDAVKRVSERGVLVVSSAGNEDRSRITYPAALADSKGATGENTLSVGSVDLNDVKSVFSNYSKSLELVAPGENVYAPYPGGMMAAWSGTSMAAPMASGGLALALGQSLKVNRRDLIKKMADTAADVYGNDLNRPYQDQLGVKGRLDLVRFLSSSVQ